MSLTKSLKKFLVILLSVLTIGLFALGFSACGTNNDDKTKEDNSNEQGQNNTNVITAAEIGAVIEGQTLTTTYNGQNQSINIEQAFEDLHITADMTISASSVQILGYKEKDSEEDFSATAPKNAGEYVAKIKISATQQNEEFIGTIGYKINKKELTGNVAFTKGYNTTTAFSAQALTTADGIIAGDTVLISATASAKFGNVTITSTALSGADASNYVFNGTATGTITKGTKTISIRGSVDEFYYLGYLPHFETTFAHEEGETYDSAIIYEKRVDGLNITWQQVTQNDVNTTAGYYRVRFTYTNDIFYEDMEVITPTFEMKTIDEIAFNTAVSVGANSTYTYIATGLSNGLYQVGTNLPNDATITIKTKDMFGKFTGTPSPIYAADKIYYLSNKILVTITTTETAISSKVFVVKYADDIDLNDSTLAVGATKTETITGTFDSDDYIIRAIDLAEGSYTLSCDNATIFVWDYYSGSFDELDEIEITEQSDTIIVKIEFTSSVTNPTLTLTKI